MNGGSEGNWLKVVMKNGTIKDKMSAAIVQIQKSAVHGLGALEMNLLSKVNLKCRRLCYSAIEAIVTLLTTDLLIPDRKLTLFDKNPFHILTELSETERDKTLFLWWFQHKLKQFYARFLEALGDIDKDNIEKTRELVTQVYKQLLTANPENEHILLTKLVSKLNDPLKKVSSEAFLALGGMIYFEFN